MYLHTLIAIEALYKIYTGENAKIIDKEYVCDYELMIRFCCNRFLLMARSVNIFMCVCLYACTNINDPTFLGANFIHFLYKGLRKRSVQK